MSAAEKIEDAIQWTPVRSWKTNPSEPDVLFTPQEYLRREAAADTKHEYVAGRMYAMAGGSPAHTFLTSDAFLAFAQHLSGTPCDALNSEAKVRVATNGPFFYPDVTVICEEPHWDEEDCLRNPVAIIEVLSPNTANFDRGDKFVYYQLISSLRHYILIDQEKVYIEHRSKQSDGTWKLSGVHTDPDDLLTLPDLGISIPLKEIYRRVLPEPERTTEQHP